jgi:hypothetical protein
MKTGELSGKIRWRIAGITGLMVVIFVAFQFLPSFAPERPGTLLRRISGDPSPHLCDVDSLGFNRVNANRSPFVMQVFSASKPTIGEETEVMLSLTTPGGRAIHLNDLMEVHTKKVHLLLVDASLEDYHHVHPQSTGIPGEYSFRFTPGSGGDYRVFADVTPAATKRPAQAVTDLSVEGEAWKPSGRFGLESLVGDYRFTLELPPAGLAIKKPDLVTLRVEHPGGKGVKLEPVMGAYAHLVGFDEERSGFAHMHPIEDGLDFQPDPISPNLDFIFYVTEPGEYMLWAQVAIGGEEVFAPFLVTVP